jgi:hypothetical protein
MPASEYLYRKANSFFEEYAATPDNVELRGEDEKD